MDGPRPVGSSTVNVDATIRSLSTIELVTADRPMARPLATRSDGLRVLSTPPSADPRLHTALTFAWSAPRSGSIGWSVPIALHLAERGPPAVAGD
jgi:hypothetical protein